MADTIGARASKRRRIISSPYTTPSSSASASSSDTSCSTRATSRSSPAASSTPKLASAPKLARFLSWCGSQGITIDPRLELRYSGDSVSWSISCHAACDIGTDEVIATIPKTAVLSRRTSALAPYLKGKWLSDDPQTVGLELALCLVYERCLGRSSSFAPFIDILPRVAVPLPLLLPRDSAAALWLTGTEAERIDHRAAYAHSDPTWRWDHQYGMSHAKALDYFCDIGIPLLQQTKLFDKVQTQHLDALQDAFVRAYTVVSSRDFIVDTYHGVGLVPVADLFNHAEAHTVQFESDQDTCELCGTALISGHDEQRCGFGPRGDEEEQEEETEVEVDDTLDMRTLAPHTSGDEMYNTYGSLSNALLLTRYAFCLDTETDFDRYTWDLRFANERREFLAAFAPLALDAVDEALDKVLQWLVCEFPKPRQDDDEEEEEEEEETGEANADGLDTLYRLDELSHHHHHHLLLLLQQQQPGEGEGEDGEMFAPLLHRSSSSATLSEPNQVDQDVVDRDQIHPLFIDGSGRMSHVVFWLVYLLHHHMTPDENMPLCRSLFASPTPTLLECTLQTMQTLLETRRSQMHISPHTLDSAFTLLLPHPSQPTQTLPLISSIHHAYHQYTALSTAITRISQHTHRERERES